MSNKQGETVLKELDQVPNMLLGKTGYLFPAHFIFHHSQSQNRSRNSRTGLAGGQEGAGRAICILRNTAIETQASEIRKQVF